MGPILGGILGQVVQPITKAVTTVIERQVPDRAKQLEIQLEIEREIMKAATAGDLAQIDLNKAEAANPNIWVSGWRPGVGWVCVAGLFLQFIFFPLFDWGFTIAAWFQCTEACGAFPKPPMLSDMLWQLVLGMLGMGGLRTFEKYKKVARE